MKDKNRPPSTEKEVPNHISSALPPDQAIETEAPSIGVDTTALPEADLSFDLPRVTALEQARASLNAVDRLNSISNQPWMQTMALIESINNPPWKKAMAMIESIENPPWKKAMAAIGSMENPPWKNALAAADSVSNPSWKKAMAAIESIKNPPWKQALAAVDSMNNPAWRKAMAVIESTENPPWKQALAAADSLNSPPWIKAMAAVESAQNPPWKQAIEAALKSINNPGLKAARAVLESLTVSSWRNVSTELDSITGSSALRMAAVAIESWGNVHSPLLDLLATDDGPDISSMLDDETLHYSESYFSSETAEHPDVPAMERQIVDLLDSGEAIEQLPATAKAHLLQYMAYLRHFMKVIMYLLTVWQTVDFVQGQLADAKNPAAVKECIAQIPKAKASLLAGHRVLIGDKVNLRTEPSEESGIKAMPKIGAVLEVVEDGDIWIKVSVDVSGEILEGWIARRYTVPLGVPGQQ